MGKPFTILTGTAAPMVEDDIDTDIIFPARFLLMMEKEGLGKYLFHDRRFRQDGSENPDFLLNRSPYKDATIIVAGDNFGSGSSREHAVWSLEDHGVRCVIATGFGEIFATNCIRSGVLPATVTRSGIDALARAATDGPLTVDLEEQTITAGELTVPFDINPSTRDALLNGWDDIDQILAEDGPAIDRFEQKRAAQTPWLYKDLLP
ncbi:MAG: 3-isopropylmalate dehydratase small subunit [Sphingomonadales bacterium]